jgi:hypothetical protein
MCKGVVARELWNGIRLAYTSWRILKISASLFLKCLDLPNITTCERKGRVLGMACFSLLKV